MRVSASSFRTGISAVLVAAAVGHVAPALSQHTGPHRGMHGTRGMMGGSMMGKCMMRGGQMPPGADPEALPPSDSAGARLVSHFCTQCHGLPTPALHSASGWPSVIQRMDMRMQSTAHYGNAPIQVPTAQQLQSIVDYMREHAGH